MLRVFFIPVLLQVLMVVHVFKTGRDRFWILILIFLPLAGGIAYLVVEILPGLLTRRRVERFGNSVSEVFVPGGKLKRLEDQASFSPTFSNVCTLGDAYLDSGRYSDAARLYKKALVSPFDTNDEYLYKQSFASYKAGEFTAADEVMERIFELGRGKLKAREMLLRARIKEGLEDWEAAEALFLEATEKTGDLSYRLDYARFLNRTGRRDDALKEYGIIQGTYDRLPGNFRKQYRAVIAEVRGEIQGLASE